jgi:hypothetical protein
MGRSLLVDYCRKSGGHLHPNVVDTTAPLTTQTKSMTPAPKRRWFRATGYPVFEALLALLLVIGAAGAVVMPVLQWMCR